MSRITVDDIQKECNENSLVFRKGKFKNGNKYRVSVSVDAEKFVWPCKNLRQCKEAIIQAAFLKEKVLV